MHKSRWTLAMVLGLMVAVALACNWSASTANLSSFKITKDQEGKTEASNFGPSDKVYALGQVSNNSGKVKVRFRVTYDDVKGAKTGEVVKGGEETIDVDGSRPVTYTITLPPAGFQNGRYKVEAAMLNEQGEQKDQKSATFNVAGYTAGPAPAPADEGSDTEK